MKLTNYINFILILSHITYKTYPKLNKIQTYIMIHTIHQGSLSSVTIHKINIIYTKTKTLNIKHSSLKTLIITMNQKQNLE